MYNYIDFEFNFAYNKAMKEKVPGVLIEGPRKAEIFYIAEEGPRYFSQCCKYTTYPMTCT